jgi:hypothetical protein
VTDYTETKTTTFEYDRIDGLGMEIVEIKVVTEYEEHEPTIKPEEGALAPPAPGFKLPNPSWPHYYQPYPRPWPDGIITCNTNASVYDLDRARARKTS